MPGFGEGLVQGLSVGGNLVNDIFRTRLAQRQQEMEMEFQPLRLQSLELGLEGQRLGLDAQRYEAENVRPIEDAIRNLQLSNAKRERRFTDWNARRQAGLEEQFPMLPLLQAIPPAAISGITNLALQQKEFEGQSKLIEQQRAADMEMVQTLQTKANEAKALKFDVQSGVNSYLDAFEKANPGFAFSVRERSGLADLAAQQVDSGALPLEALPDALGAFLSQHPRVQGRLSALAGPESAPLPMQDAPTASPLSVFDVDTNHLIDRLLRGELTQEATPLRPGESWRDLGRAINRAVPGYAPPQLPLLPPLQGLQAQQQ